MSEWQPIETAPKDGTPILICSGPFDFPFIGHWAHVGRYTSSPCMWIGHSYGAMGADDVTHWMPLPPPPQGSQQG